MELTDPLTLLKAWVIVPVLIALASGGLGLLVGRLARLPLGALTLPTGFLTGVVIITALLQVGLPAIAATLVCAAIALVGLALAVREHGRGLLRRPSLPFAVAGLSGLGAFAVGMAPVVLSGRSVVLGYILNNDPSVHVATTELLIDRGDDPGDVVGSSYDYVGGQLGNGYPLGSYAWPIFGRLLGSVETFHIWSPIAAVAAAMVALTTYALLRSFGMRPVLAGVAGTTIASGFLPFSYLAQGGSKEIELLVGVYTTVALFALAARHRLDARALLPAVLAASGASYVFGGGAAAWIGPAALVFAIVVLVRAADRAARVRIAVAMAVALGLAVLVTLPSIIDTLRLVPGNNALRDENEVGNLLGPVPWIEAFNVWWGTDYRFDRPVEEWPTYLYVGVAALLGVAGLVAAIRRRDLAVPLSLVAGVAGVLLIAPRYPIYFDAKAYVVLAPALGLATAAGIAALTEATRPRLRTTGLAVGALFVAGVLVSVVFVHRGVWLTPKDRFAELIQIDERLGEGDAPLLLHDREQYGFYFLRDHKPWEAWGFWQPDRGFRAGRIPRTVPYTPDLDDYQDYYIAKFPTIVERKRPGGSRAPGNYAVAFETPHYRVWRRTGPPPAVHLPLPTTHGGAALPLSCRSDAGREILRAARRGTTVRAALGVERVELSWPAGWQWIGGQTIGSHMRGFQLRSKGFGVGAERLPRGTYEVWAQGSFGPGLRSYHRDKVIGEAYGDYGLPSQWQRMGTVRVRTDDQEFLMYGLSRRAWQPGSAQLDITGPVAFFPTGTRAGSIVELPASQVRRLCGQPLDWVEVL